MSNATPVPDAGDVDYHGRGASFSLYQLQDRFHQNEMKKEMKDCVLIKQMRIALSCKAMMGETVFGKRISTAFVGLGETGNLSWRKSVQQKDGRMYKILMHIFSARASTDQCPAKSRKQYNDHRHRRHIRQTRQPRDLKRLKRRSVLSTSTP